MTRTAWFPSRRWLLSLALLLSCLAVLSTTAVAQQPAAKVQDQVAAPTEQAAGHQIRDLEGWQVHIDPLLLEQGDQAELGSRALSMLANHLQRIRILVPSPALEKLQTIAIWIDYQHPALQGMQYHPSRRWLADNGHDPQLAKKVHVCRAEQLLSREQMLKHPAVILHELAHGFHDQILGFDHPPIRQVFEKAKAAGSYERVLLYTGAEVRHYGLTDHKEYFAEGTEAYFYRNDFFPFVRAELKRHDPEFHDLLKQIWEAKD